MADVTDPFRAAARLAKTAALKTEVVSAWWGTVASVSGDDISVVLDGDDLLQVQPVTVNATGPCLVGDDVLLQMQGRDLTIVANPTAQARMLTDTGWLSASFASGFSGALRYRRIGPVVYVNGNLTRTAGAFTTTMETVWTIPAGFRPQVYLRFPLSTYANTSGIGLQATVETGGAFLVAQAGPASNATVYVTASWPAA